VSQTLPAADSAAFLDAARGAITDAEGCVAVVLVDVEGLRRINDALGRPAGDAILAGVHDRLLEAARDVDVVGRVGGDEFAVLFSGFSNPEDATSVTTRLTWAVERANSVDGQPVAVRVACGLVVAPAEGADAERLLDDAGAALYSAKSQDQRVVVYSDELRRSSARRYAVRAALTNALDRNAFHLHYQRLFDFASLEAVGVEALLRWDDPGLGPVSPVDFIPVAEETGLIVPLGHWVLRTAAAQVAKWGDIGVSVNVSARQLAEPDLIFQVHDVLRETGIRPDRLTLEITESQVMRNLDIAIPAMSTLRGFGVRLSIDDFGTGYSSLTHLKRIPADELKLDRGFVSDLPGDERDRAVVRGVVELAHALGMHTVAEGVETQEQLDVLRELGCDIAQGFLLARPAAPDQVAEALGGVD
jgi:diguanylate cyclase (GGDEF)-like protein